MKIMKRIVVYIHGKSGSAGEAKFYEPVLKGYDVTGFDYKSLTPWNAKYEFLKFFEPLRSQYNSLFGDRTGATLTVMQNGEHCFHTEEQLDFLRAWITQSLR